MAQPFVRKGRYKTRSQERSLNTARNAAARGIGGGLLLGFSDCGTEDKGSAIEGETYVAPLNRLRAVHHKADKMYWHFEPIIGTQAGNTDIIELALDSALATPVWSNIAYMIGGDDVGDTFVWVHNKCSRGDDVDGNPVLIPNVTGITITLASVG